MKNILAEVFVLFSYPKNIILLVCRIVIAYGFSLPALVKINDTQGTVKKYLHPMMSWNCSVMEQILLISPEDL